nr:PREDICTED: protocadherin alpha-4-like [Equus przewalskii]
MLIYSQKRGVMLAAGPDGQGARRLLLSLLLLAAWEARSGQVHYSVPEEAKHGTFVGRIAQDLGLELAELVPRLFRVASKGRGDLLEVNLQNGILFVNSRIDREELCGRSLECSIHLEVIVDRPLQVFHVEVEVKDINDNPPMFLVKEQKLFVSESRMPDSRFPLEGASDADIGANSNDNAPALLPPGAGGGAGAVSELVSRSVGAGHVVAKVRAVDADSGYNAWLSFELQPAAGGGRSPFRVGLYTGEISTTRVLDEADAPRQRLLVLVKDHGEPALTATATVLLSLMESGPASKASSRASPGAVGSEVALVDVNVYLIIAICAVSSLLVLTLLLYTALRCSAPPIEGACVPGKPRQVCSSAVGTWSYSQQKRQRVCSGEGQPKTDLMAFSPSVPPGWSSGDSGDQHEISGNWNSVVLDVVYSTHNFRRKVSLFT